jgi:hypothetical protein
MEASMLMTRGTLLMALHDAAAAGQRIMLLVPTEAGGLMPHEVTLDAAIELSKWEVLAAVPRPGELVLIRRGRTSSRSGPGLVALGRAGWRADAAAKPVGAPTRTARGALRLVVGSTGSTCRTGDSDRIIR